MIAALPMYDRAETAAAHDALWSLVREAHGGDLPAALSRDLSPEEGWSHPALALGQICGLPFGTTYRGRLSYVASGDYDVSSPPGHYHSVWLVRADDDREELGRFSAATFAFNAADSQSGWAAPMQAASAAGIRFAALHRTGAHRESARAVAEGRADIAGLDAVTWRAVARFDGFARRLRVLGVTPPTAGLPFVVAPGGDADRMFHALAAAIGMLPQGHRDTLGLRGAVRLPLEAYDALAAASTR